MDESLPSKRCNISLTFCLVDRKLLFSDFVIVGKL